MIRVIGALGLLAFLAACGADGMPTRPEAKTEVAVESAPEIG